MEKIIVKNWDYILYKKDHDFILSVVCGTVGIFERNVILTPEETAAYQQQGAPYIESLARKICYASARYKTHSHTAMVYGPWSTLSAEACVGRCVEVKEDRLLRYLQKR